MKLPRTALLVPFDFLAVWLSARWTPAVRHLFDPEGALGEALFAARPMLDPLLIAVLWCGAFAWLGLYRPVHRLSPSAIFVSVLGAAGMSLLLVVTATFFLVRQDFLPARSLPPLQAALAVPLVTLGRLGGLALLAALARTGWGRSRVAVVGTGETAVTAANLLESEGLMGSEVVGHILGVRPAPVPDELRGRPLLGPLADLAGIVSRQRIDRIVIAEEEVSLSMQRTLALYCQRLGAELDRVADFGSAGRHEVVPGTLGELPLIRVGRVAPNRLGLGVKRVVDLAVAAALLVLLAPVIAVITIALAVEGAGHVILSQPRVGRGGRIFQMYKFRSMRDGERRHTTAWDGHLWKDPADPRVTRVGRVLRRYSLDELPQLVNVLRGEMSLVGPRPLPADDLGPDGQSLRYPAWSEVRGQLRPGITGLWQVRGRKELSFEEMMRLDVFYCENWTLLLDFAVLLRTFPAVLHGRGAY